MDCLASPTTKRRRSFSSSLFPPHSRYTSWRCRSLVSWNSSTMMYRNCLLHFASTSGCCSSRSRAFSSRSSKESRADSRSFMSRCSRIPRRYSSQAGASDRALTQRGYAMIRSRLFFKASMSALLLPFRCRPLLISCRICRFSCFVRSFNARCRFSVLSSNVFRLPGMHSVINSGVTTPGRRPASCTIAASSSSYFAVSPPLAKEKPFCKRLRVCSCRLRLPYSSQSNTAA